MAPIQPPFRLPALLCTLSPNVDLPPHTNLGIWFLSSFLEQLDSHVSIDMTYPWLREFHDTKSTFEASLAYFESHPSKMTDDLLDHLESIAYACLGKRFEKLLEKLGARETPITANSVRSMISESPGLVELVGGHFRNAIYDWRLGRADLGWNYLSEPIRRFCLLAGCRRTSPNPFDNLGTLRDAAARKRSIENKSLLLGQLKYLQDQLRAKDKQIASQSRIITNLSYRHLLEGLSGFPPPGQATPKWESFWQAALIKAAAPSATTPLTDVLSTFHVDTTKVDRKNAKASKDRNFRTLLDVGEKMYGTLSNNIHNYIQHYPEKFDVDPSQWDVMPGAILQALAPNANNIDTKGNVDWNAERSRH